MPKTIISTLEKAIALAATQHAGQLDKGGQPYILHPLRLMLQFSNPTLQIIAVLHDILEDTATTAEDLEALGFTVLNPLATQVKYVDVLDNMNLTRINNPTAHDFARLEEYKVVLEILKQAKTQRNP